MRPPDSGQVCHSLIVVSYCKSRIGTGPCREGNLVPQVRRFDRLHDLTGCPCAQLPIFAALDFAQELVCHANGVIGVLARNGQVSIAIPIGIVGRDFDFGETLPSHFDYTVDIVVWNQRTACLADGFLQLWILFWIQRLVDQAVLASSHKRFHVLVQVLGTRNKACDLLLFDPFPADVILNIR